MRCVGFLVLSLIAPVAALAADPSAAPPMTVAEVVTHNSVARGGKAAWTKVQTMIWEGRLETSAASTEHQPFVFKLQRPRRTRLEVLVKGQLAVWIYDGSKGWKLIPDQAGHTVVSNYAARELTDASHWPDIDGLLMDYAAKGYQIAIEGIEPVEGRDAYRLKVIFPGGDVRHLWVDTHSFLDLKLEVEPRNVNDAVHPAYVFYRDYRDVEGLKVPYVLETAVDGVRTTRKMIIEKITVNPRLDVETFSVPKTVTASAAKIPAVPPKPGSSASKTPDAQKSSRYGRGPGVVPEWALKQAMGQKPFGAPIPAGSVPTPPASPAAPAAPPASPAVSAAPSAGPAASAAPPASNTPSTPPATPVPPAAPP
jgi:hypothetical protein